MNSKQDAYVEDMGDGVANLVLNRAPVNALTPLYLKSIAIILDQLEDDKNVKSVLISSALKVFSAGLDLKEAQNFEQAEQQAVAEGLNTTFTKLYGFPKPTIAAINGTAIAGGLFFVLASDYRLCAGSAKFGLAEVRVGVDFQVGPLEIARDTLSSVFMRRMMLGGKPVGAETALSAGIVDSIEDDGQVMDQAVKKARDYAAIPPIAFASIKRQIRGPAIERINRSIKMAAASGTDSWYNEETKSAMAAMIN